MPYLGITVPDFPNFFIIYGPGTHLAHGGNKMVWAHPAVKHSYFKNADGQIHTVSPWRLNEYWAAVREPDWSQFVVRRRK